MEIEIGMEIIYFHSEKIGMRSRIILRMGIE